MRIQHAVAAAAVILVPAIYLVVSNAVLNAADSQVADAAMKGDKAAVQTLIKQKADVNLPQADGATAIQWAAYRNDVDMADLLIAAGADVKKPNRDGATALRLASINGSAPMIQRLLKAGADANELSPNGETPLMFAARNGNVDAIKVLHRSESRRERERKAARHHAADVGRRAIASRGDEAAAGERRGLQGRLQFRHQRQSCVPGAHRPAAVGIGTRSRWFRAR